MNDDQHRKKDKLAYSDAWSKENAVKFYSSHRNSLDEVYKSEKYFLSEILEPKCSVLDLGCAAGGFYNIFKKMESTLSYTGVDISPDMIKKAQLLNPDVPFYVSKGSELLFNDRSFDVVFCSGALHMTFDWRDVLKEGWRVTKKYFVFDVRLTENVPTIEDIDISYEKIAFFDEWDGSTIVPYIILNVRDFLQSLQKFNPAPALQKFYGYYHPVSDMTISPERQVCMTMCCLAKNKQPNMNDSWEIPIKKPE